MTFNIYKIIYRKLFEAGFIEVFFSDEEQAEKFFKWLYPDDKK